MRYIAKKNGITLTDFVDVPTLADLVAQGDYARVHRSMSRKANVLYEIAGRAQRGKLKTEAGLFDHVGGWPA